MSCKNNNKGCSLDMGRGCVFCNCETEAEAAICEGCFKLHSTDWLEGFPNQYDEDIFEVRFKNTRRSYYKNVNNLPLKRGDIVAVEASPGHDIGIVSLTGDMVARQMKRVGFTPMNGEFKKIYRKAKPYDIEKWQEAIALEHETMIRSRQIAAEMGLNMKIGDVEYQGDRIKAIFYYIADERVDFRELIKVFAEQFRIRVEMKQIGARQEAGRIGGLGSCGRELCCASWISSFVSVTTNAARTQEISLNPQKLAGQCSKLKCCLVYELDSYMDARREFPRVNQPLQALDGEYYLVKSDILGRTMSFSTTPNAMIGVVTLPIERVVEIQEINKKGKKVDSLTNGSTSQAPAPAPDFINVIGEESITRFDKVKGEGNKRRKKRGGKSNNNAKQSGDNQNSDNSPQDSGEKRNKPSAAPKQDNAENRTEGAQPRSNRNRSKGGGRNRSQREGGQGNQREGGQVNQRESGGSQREGGQGSQREGNQLRKRRNENKPKE